MGSLNEPSILNVPYWVQISTSLRQINSDLSFNLGSVDVRSFDPVSSSEHFFERGGHLNACSELTQVTAGFIEKLKLMHVLPLMLNIQRQNAFL